MNSTQIKKLYDIAIVKLVIKAMGGKLEIESTYDQTNLILHFPCKI
jgi:hypothetical protein